MIRKVILKLFKFRPRMEEKLGRYFEPNRLKCPPCLPPERILHKKSVSLVYYDGCVIKPYNFLCSVQLYIQIKHFTFECILEIIQNITFYTSLLQKIIKLRSKNLMRTHKSSFFI